MVNVSYDLHIHSCLSPCGDEDMTPANIVNMALIKELDVIAVTDHNSSKNCSAVMEYGQKMGLIVLPGMELCTQEEVHVLCLFEHLEDAMNFDSYVSERLIQIPNHEGVFGKQEIYNGEDEKIGDYPYLLISATNISFHELGKLMDKFHGVYIPAHVEKGSYSLISNLGFIPPESDFIGVEIKEQGKTEELLELHSYLRGCYILHNSDAHYLEHIHEPIYQLKVEEKSKESVWKALTKKMEVLL